MKQGKLLKPFAIFIAAFASFLIAIWSFWRVMDMKIPVCQSWNNGDFVVPMFWTIIGTACAIWLWRIGKESR